MERTTPEPKPNAEASNHLGSLADELSREAERLQRLAAELKAREEALAEMQANYPHFKKVVYAMLRERAEREMPPIPDGVDLETWAKEQGAMPIEAFIDELERLAADDSQNGG